MLIHRNFSVTVPVLPSDLSSKLHARPLSSTSGSDSITDTPNPKEQPLSFCPVVQLCRCLILLPMWLWLITLTGNRSALLPLRSLSLLPWAPDDCLMSGHETMGSRCVIDGERTMFISGEALWFWVTEIRSHPLAWSALWLHGWLMGLYWQCEGPVTSLTQIQNNMLRTAHAVGNAWIHLCTYAGANPGRGETPRCQNDEFPEVEGLVEIGSVGICEGRHAART